MTTYKPQPGSLAALVCDWFSRHRDEELTTSDIGRKWSDVTVASDVHSKLAAAIKYGWLVRGPSIGSTAKVYSAGPELPDNIPSKPQPTIQTVWARPVDYSPTTEQLHTGVAVEPAPRRASPSSAYAINRNSRIDLNNLKVEKDIPIGRPRGDVTPKWEPLLNMLTEAGHSVALPLQMQGGLMAYVVKINKGGGRQFVVRKVSNDQCRIWRTV